MKAISREELLALLEQGAIKPRLKRELRFRPEEISDWEDRDFVAVMSRTKTEGALIAELGELYVVPFRLQKRAANHMGRTEAVICDFCTTWQRGSHSTVISFQKEKGSTSFLVCGDLLCSLHVRDKTNAAKLSRTQLWETISIEGKIQRLKSRMEGILQALR